MDQDLNSTSFFGSVLLKQAELTGRVMLVPLCLDMSFALIVVRKDENVGLGACGVGADLP